MTEQEEMQREMDNLRFANLYMHDMYTQMKDALYSSEKLLQGAIEFLEELLKERSLSPLHKACIEEELQSLRGGSK